MITFEVSKYNHKERVRENLRRLNICNKNIIWK